MSNETKQAFNELVDLYSQIIVNSENETIHKVQNEPLYDLVSEDEAEFRIGYQDRIADYKQCLDDYVILLVCQHDSLGLPELDYLIFEQSQELELFIEDLVEYRDIFGYKPDVESKVFSLDGYLEFGESPPTPQILLQATIAMLEESDRDRRFLDNSIVSERDLQLARDCREILNSQDPNLDDRISTFQRLDGQGKYVITLDRQSDAIFLQSNSYSDLPKDLILVESKGKVLYSKAADLSADQIRQAVLLLNVEKSQSIEIKNEKNETLTR
jgi:hypothetical protein